MRRIRFALSGALVMLGATSAWADAPQALPHTFDDQAVLTHTQLNENFGRLLQDVTGLDAALTAGLARVDTLASALGDAEAPADGTVLARLAALEQQNQALTARLAALEAQVGLGEPAPEGAVITRLAAVEGVAEAARVTASANAGRLDTADDGVIHESIDRSVGSVGADFPTFQEAFDYLRQRRLAPDVTVTLRPANQGFLIDESIEFYHPQGHQISVVGQGPDVTTLTCTTDSSCWRIVNGRLGGIRDLTLVGQAGGNGIEVKNGVVELANVTLETFGTALNVHEGARIIASDLTIVRPGSYGAYFSRSSGTLTNTTVSGPAEGTGGAGLVAVASQVFLGAPEAPFLAEHLTQGIVASTGGTVWGGQVQVSDSEVGLLAYASGVINVDNATVLRPGVGLTAETGGAINANGVTINTASGHCVVGNYGASFSLEDATLLGCGGDGVLVGFGSLARVNGLTASGVGGRGLSAANNATIFGAQGVSIAPEEADSTSCHLMPAPVENVDPSTWCSFEP